jgi:hypothetical protein
MGATARQVGKNQQTHFQTGMTVTFCPYLGTLDDEHNPAPPVDYPSFENRCMATPRGEAILLSDQGTFCLSKGHRFCPRYVAAVAAKKPAHHPSLQHAGVEWDENPTGSPTVAFPGGVESIDSEIATAYAETRPRSNRWGWVGAAMIFVSSLLCGGSFAAYIGWQLVNSNLLAATPLGSVDTLSDIPSQPVQPQIYLVVTATSEPPTPASEPANASAAVAFQYPEAVTATPGVAPLADQSAVPVQSGQPDVLPVQGPDASGFTGTTLATEPFAIPEEPTAALINMELEIPTRRPTPILDIPTSTPIPEELLTPTPTPTPTIVLGPAIVVFSARDPVLQPGECTRITWRVENVRAVYYENLGVEGVGERRECVDNRAQNYHLLVMMPDGSTKHYTTTVEVVFPTATPTVTPTFTPEVEATPTWTPVVPTSTPTPVINYGALLSIDGDSSPQCAPGSSCTIDLLVTNTSATIDSISLVLMQDGSWKGRLCRLDGVCAGDRLTLVSMGPSNTGLVRFMVDIPAGSGGQSSEYLFRAISEGSGGASGSDAIAITIRASDP